MMLLATMIRSKQRAVWNWLWIGAAFQLLALPALAANQLGVVIEMAQQNDPWLTGNEYKQEAVEAQSVAAGTLPDPIVNAGFANMPTDSWEFNEEPMTQFKVGVVQMFPRGDSLNLSQKQLAQMSSQYPYQREDRRAKVAVTVSQLWLELYRSNRTIQLIEGDRALFEHLVDVAESNYSTAVGRTRQQDLVRAQLELTRLEDRLVMLDEKLQMSVAQLGEWLSPGPTNGTRHRPSGMVPHFTLPDTLPEIALAKPELFESSHQLTAQEIATFLVNHPAVLDIDVKIEVSDTAIALAEQKYKPEWGINASYGYRDNSPSGQDRPDFFSAGITFDLPLFTSKRQDKQVQSAIATTEAVRTERALLLRSMVATFETQHARLQRLEQRRDLYRARLLAEMQEQAEASLNAYTSDAGDFAEVVRARIAELNARIDALNIEVDRMKTISQLNYFFTKSIALDRDNPK